MLHTHVLQCYLEISHWNNKFVPISHSCKNDLLLVRRFVLVVSVSLGPSAWRPLKQSRS